MLYRTTVLATALVVAAIPGVAHAASPVVDGVKELASDATEVVIEEQALLGALAESTTPSPELDAQLRAADGQGVALLRELEQLGVDLSPVTVTVLSRLPAAGDGFPPQSVAYDAAIAELTRIAATPRAVLPRQSDGNGPGFGLIAVAAIALLVLGAAALGSTLRRNESDEELAAMAWSDGLTGLANRRRFDHDVASYDSDQTPVAAIMIDVDHFKVVNDTFGHPKGDEVLRCVADVLAERVREGDVVYRYGGEEFCVLLPGATRADAVAVGDRIVEACRLITLPDDTHLTVSVGVAHLSEATASESFESADQALLAAKELGRDRAVEAASLTLETV
jgi:diguanylate cyclase (GGDEF)-like protein